MKQAREHHPALCSLTGDAVGAVVPPFIKGGLGGISETAAQANVAKSLIKPLSEGLSRQKTAAKSPLIPFGTSFPLWERGRSLPRALSVASLLNEKTAFPKGGSGRFGQHSHPDQHRHTTSYPYRSSGLTTPRPPRNQLPPFPKGGPGGI